MDANYNKTRLVLIGNAIVGLAIIIMSIALLKGSGFYETSYSGLWGSALIYGALIVSGRSMKYNQDVKPYKFLGGGSAVVSLVAGILHIVRISDDIVKSYKVACKDEIGRKKYEESCNEFDWAYPLLIVVMILFFVNVIVSGVGVFFAHKASITTGSANAAVH